MHSQARAFLQPTRANIHQYQFNNPILFDLSARERRTTPKIHLIRRKFLSLPKTEILTGHRCEGAKYRLR